MESHETYSKTGPSRSEARSRGMSSSVWKYRHVSNTILEASGSGFDYDIPYGTTSVSPDGPDYRALVKMEDILSDDESDSAGRTLKSFQLDNENRESPNSSMTSTSLTSVLPDTEHLPHAPPGQKKTHPNEISNTFQLPKTFTRFRAKSSIPTRLHPEEYARQSVAAAYSSRLNPYALHEDEHRLLRDRLCHLHVTVYLNIRNGILRLWVRNPGVSVNLEEAIGCAKDERWTRLACFAYEWLVRKGYINFGCVEVPLGINTSRGRRKESIGETIVVIGGGMAGLSCARQLTGLFQNFPNHPTPRIVVLEGRRRIGGRIYSHPLSCMNSRLLEPHQRPTAEMGAHIIVGFEHGNPLDPIIRGQLALKYHSLRDLSTLYDIDGTPVDESQDTMVERLYNDVLDRTGRYRDKNKVKKTAEGDKEMIDSGRDPTLGDGVTVGQYEEAAASGTIDLLLPTKSRRRGAGHKAAKANKPTEEAETNMETQTQLPAGRAAKEIGFALRVGTRMDEDLKLDDLAVVPHQSLGAVMNDGVNQYQRFLDLKPKAMRLLNWHFANLEYANAATVDRLSLRGWDQDVGNEFEGEHAQVVGGYQQVPRALWRYPDKLDVRANKAVASIKYSPVDQRGKALVRCEDGETFEADRVIVTVPLGVLKQQSISFDPPLPDWKQDAISRLGFGLLNKVVLVFENPFWDVDRDMFGLLRAPRSGNGINQNDYRAGRGQYYLFWNCIQTSGLPVLIALIAGEAALEAEQQADRELVSQCVDQLRNVFGPDRVTTPLETIVTRWGSDRFARGTYSFVAANAQPVDYDCLAKPIGNLFFAGEATCGTHPATVHGAYLSGLRAASETLDSIIGPIQVPTTTLPSLSKAKKTSTDLGDTASPAAAVQPKRKGDPILPAGTFTRPVKEKCHTYHEAYDDAMWVRIYNDLGAPPPRPAKSCINPFLVFQKHHWNTVKAHCDALKQQNGKKPDAKAGRDEVRIELGKMWRALGDNGRAPYSEETKKNKQANDEAERRWRVAAGEWDRRTWEVKDVWVKEGNSFDEWVQRQKQQDAEMDAAALKRARQ